MLWDKIFSLLLVVCIRLKVYLQNNWREPKACLFVTYLFLHINLCTSFLYLCQISCSKFLNAIWCWCIVFPWRGKLFLRGWMGLASTGVSCLGTPVATGKTGSAAFIVIPNYCVLNPIIKEWLRLDGTVKIVHFHSSCRGQNCQLLDQAPQDPIQPGHECLQRWEKRVSAQLCADHVWSSHSTSLVVGRQSY